MSFTSFDFLFLFLPAFLAVYLLLPARWREVAVFAGSMAFYALGAGLWCAALLLGVTLFVFGMARAISRSEGDTRRMLTIFAVFAVLCVLAYFKYTDFFLENLAALLRTELALPQLLLPLGLSFYSFQAVGYLVDVHRGMEAERGFAAFGAFLTAFPQLTMGPTLRYGDVRGALRAHRVTKSALELGFGRFVVGLSCKVLLADRLAALWQALERTGFESISTPLSWLGAVGYSMQLYFDFAGYSLMAMGLGEMLGLPVPRNFDLPYLSRTVGEFYRRWHSTLGSWFRDYLYIPLGGSRCGTVRTVRNLLVVWALTGLWHGASWNFVLWGLALFVLIAGEKLLYGQALARSRVLGHVYVLFFIPVTWVLFRITDLSQLGVYLARMFPFFGVGETLFAGDVLHRLSEFWQPLLVGALLCLPWPRRFYEAHRARWWMSAVLLVLFFLCVRAVSLSSGDAFLYANF